MVESTDVDEDGQISPLREWMSARLAKLGVARIESGSLRLYKHTQLPFSMWGYVGDGDQRWTPITSSRSAGGGNFGRCP